MKSLFSKCLVLFVVVGFVACKKNVTPIPAPPGGGGKSTAVDIESYNIDGIPAQTTIVESDNTVYIQFTDTLLDAEKIAASFTLSKGATASINGTKQVSGVSKNNYEQGIDMLVTAEDGVTAKYWHISGTNNENTMPWGLGHILQKSVANNRDYEWYMGQSQTGSYSTINCGPTSVTMAIKWYDSTFDKTPLDARNSTQTDGGLWYPATVVFYLQKYNIPFVAVNLSDTITSGTAKLREQIDEGRITMLMIASAALRICVSDTVRVDRYYSWNNGHFIIVKGYTIVDGQTFFEVYDPWDYELYKNGAGSMGKDRYYRAEDLLSAAQYNGGGCWSIPPPK